MASVSAMSASTVSSAPAYVAHQVFGEMPAQNSLQETHGKAPGHHNPSQKSFVNTNLSVQNLDGMPQSYGFSNLDRQSIFLADGTEHSYFTLPAGYPLEQDTPPMSPSTGQNVGVSVAAQAAGLAPGCCSETNNTAGSEMMLGYNLQLPRTMQDYHNGLMEMHVSEEAKQESEHLLKCISKAPKTEQTIACLNYISDLLDYTLEQQQQDNENASASAQQLRAPPLNVLVIDEIRNEWDPGDHTFLSSTLNEDIFGVPNRVPQQSCYYRVPSSQEHHGIQFLWNLGILSLMDMMLSKTTVPNLMDLKHFWAQLLLQYHSWCATPNAFLQVPDSCLPIVLGCLHSEPFKQLDCYSGIFSLLAMHMSTATNVHMILVLSYGNVAQEGRDEAAHLTQADYLCSLYCNSVLKTSYVWDPGVHIYLYSWLNILLVWTAADKQLSCTHIPDLAVWRNQLVGSAASYLWEPGIDSLLFVYIWLHLHMFQLVYYSAICACHLVSALLPLTQVTAKGSTNIEVAVLTSKYMISHLHQTTNWISTTSNGIRSFEYGYTMNCLSEQWEFLHQQGFRNDSNATNQLSSLNYLQLWELDIIFITYLPP